MQSPRTLARALVVTFVACSTLVGCINTAEPKAVKPRPTTVARTTSAITCSASWNPTGDLSQERFAGTAVRLMDGTVVVAGGYGTNGPVAGAEKYDPSSGAWSAAGTLNVPRYYHGAVALRDGRVLVVGGWTDQGPTASAEAYDPVAKTWSNLAPMSTDRYVPQVALLADGRVLVSGGISGTGGPSGIPGTQASAEIYDPLTNAWSSAGTMASPRFYAAMALLPDGRILMAGGNNGANSDPYLSSAEIFDPLSGTWTVVHSMSVTRYSFGMAVLRNGKVLAAGGSDALPGAEIYDPITNSWSPTGAMVEASRAFFEMVQLPDGRVLAAGGVGSAGLLADAEVFDPEPNDSGQTNQWSRIADMGTQRNLAMSAVLLDGRILVAGGQDLYGGNIKAAETYRPCTASCGGPWSTTGSMTQERLGATAVRLTNGEVFVAGGIGNTGFVAGAEQYNPATGAWSPAGTLTVPRYLHRAVALMDGRVLVVGGYSASGATATAEIYNPTTKAWSGAASMSTARAMFQVTVLSDGRVLVSGGLGSSSPLASAEIYDPVRNSWSSAGSMSSWHYRGAAALLSGGKVLVAGGGSGGPNDLASADIYDPSRNTWSSAASMSVKRSAFGAAVLRDGRVLVAGGSDQLPGAEIYNPVTNNWSPSGNMVHPRSPLYAPEVLPLLDGSVAVAGGLTTSGEPAGVEVFDPQPNQAGTTSQWSAVSNMVTARNMAVSAVLRDGRILLAGGQGAAGDIINSAETYKPCPHACGGPWSPSGDMTKARELATATSLTDGTVIVAGGLDASSTLLDSAEKYDPTTGTWSGAGTMKSARAGHRAVRLQDGRVLVVGGFTNSGATKTAEIYSSGTWSYTSSMSYPRVQPQVALLTDGRVLVSGGQGGDATSEIYDPVRGTWSLTTGAMNVARVNAGVTLLPGGKVLVAGGADTTYLQSAEIFDPSAGTWSLVTNSMSVPRYSPGMAVLPDGRVLVIGGSQSSPGAEIFNPTSGQWSSTGNMAQASRYYFETIPMADGRVLVAGGISDPTDPASTVDRVEIFTPALNTWSSLDYGMRMPRSQAMSAQLPYGRILIAGGRGGAGVTKAAETYYPCPNLAPVALCRNVIIPASATTCTGTGASVDSGSYDPDDAPVSPLTITQSPPSTTTFALGSTPVTLTVSDGDLSSTCQSTVTVVDVTPPNPGGSKGMVLWPANGTFYEVTLMDCADFTYDVCSGRLNPLRDYGIVTYVTSDEPNDFSSGDIVVKKSWLTLLRASRDNNGNGRVYTIHYMVSDPAGNPAFGYCQVGVPKTQGGTAIDSGSSNGYCAPGWNNSPCPANPSP